jgi:hypothetical protein
MRAIEEEQKERDGGNLYRSPSSS